MVSVRRATLWLVLMAGCGRTLGVDDPPGNPDASSPDGGEAGVTDDASSTMPDGGGGGGDANCTVPLPAKRFAFVASAPITGRSAAGLATFDEHCNTLAHAAGVSASRSFVAYVRASGLEQPWTRIDIMKSEPWYRADGKIVFATANQPPTKPSELFNLTERCGIASDAGVWTGGNSPSDPYCDGWKLSESDATAPPTASIGDPNENGLQWDQGGVSPCGLARHLYCFEQ